MAKAYRLRNKAASQVQERPLKVGAMETPQHEIGQFPSFLRDFRIFWVGFRYIYILLVSRFFRSVSSFFWASFRFSKKVLNSQFVDRFPLFLVPFPVFRKSINSKFVDRFPLF